MPPSENCSTEASSINHQIDAVKKDKDSLPSREREKKKKKREDTSEPRLPMSQSNLGFLNKVQRLIEGHVVNKKFSLRIQLGSHKSTVMSIITSR
jgi:hypothetical protein